MGFTPNKIQLELHVEDFEIIKNYYAGLGFRIIWEREPDGLKGYLVVDLEGNTLCFWAGNQHVYDQPHFKQFPKDTPRGYGVEIIIMVKDILSFYEQVRSVANVVEPLAEQPWGLWDFRAVDPAGYYLRFTSEHDIHNSNNAVT
jgi:hypothetical protein